MYMKPYIDAYSQDAKLSRHYIAEPIVPSICSPYLSYWRIYRPFPYLTRTDIYVWMHRIWRFDTLPKRIWGDLCTIPYALLWITCPQCKLRLIIPYPLDRILWMSSWKSKIQKIITLGIYLHHKNRLLGFLLGLVGTGLRDCANDKKGTSGTSGDTLVVRPFHFEHVCASKNLTRHLYASHS